MKTAMKRFLRDEGGAVTVDSVGVIGGSIWMALSVVADISVATMNLTDQIDERLEYASILSEILGDYGPGSDLNGGTDSGTDSSPDSGAESDNGSDDGDDDCVGNAGNPGNDKCVGNAGENPNGKDGWGDSDRGRSN